jgi:hypothetical protein
MSTPTPAFKDVPTQASGRWEVATTGIFTHERALWVMSGGGYIQPAITVATLGDGSVFRVAVLEGGAWSGDVWTDYEPVGGYSYMPRQLDDMRASAWLLAYVNHKMHEYDHPRMGQAKKGRMDRLLFDVDAALEKVVRALEYKDLRTLMEMYIPSNARSESARNLMGYALKIGAIPADSAYRAHAIMRQREDENGGEEFFFTALHHRDTALSKGERYLDGWFVPDVLQQSPTEQGKSIMSIVHMDVKSDGPVALLKALDLAMLFDGHFTHTRAGKNEEGYGTMDFIRHYGSQALPPEYTPLPFSMDKNPAAVADFVSAWLKNGDVYPRPNNRGDGSLNRGWRVQVRSGLDVTFGMDPTPAIRVTTYFNYYGK